MKQIKILLLSTLFFFSAPEINPVNKQQISIDGIKTALLIGTMATTVGSSGYLAKIEACNNLHTNVLVAFVFALLSGVIKMTYSYKDDPEIRFNHACRLMITPDLPINLNQVDSETKDKELEELLNLAHQKTPKSLQIKALNYGYFNEHLATLDAKHPLVWAAKILLGYKVDCKYAVRLLEQIKKDAKLKEKCEKKLAEIDPKLQGTQLLLEKITQLPSSILGSES